MPETTIRHLITFHRHGDGRRLRTIVTPLAVTAWLTANPECAIVYEKMLCGDEAEMMDWLEERDEE